jgi:hypothetical protein
MRLYGAGAPAPAAPGLSTRHTRADGTAATSRAHKAPDCPHDKKRSCAAASDRDVSQLEKPLKIRHIPAKIGFF